MAGAAVISTGCKSAYPDLAREIDQAVAAARPDSATASTAAATPRPQPTPTNLGTPVTTQPSAGTSAANPGSVAATPGMQTSQPAQPAQTASAGMTSPMTAMPGAGGMGARVTMVANLPAPEGIVVDTTSGVLLVAGSEAAAAGTRGLIMRMDQDGSVRNARWIVGGTKGAILRSPRGMAIVAETLWVADGTVLRGFNRSSGAPVANIALGALGAVSLTDVAVGGDGALYVVDPAVTYSARGVAQRAGAGRIYRVQGRTPSVALEHARLMQPSSLSWDPIMGRFLIGGGATDTILGWRPSGAANTPETVGVAAGPWDGVMAIGGAVFYGFNSARGEVVQFANGSTRRVVQGVRGAGDIAFDAARGRMFVPVPGENRVEIWEVRR